MSQNYTPELKKNRCVTAWTGHRAAILFNSYFPKRKAGFLIENRAGNIAGSELLIKWVLLKTRGIKAGVQVVLIK